MSYKEHTINGVKWALADYYPTVAKAEHGAFVLTHSAPRLTLIRKLPPSNPYYKKGWRYVLYYKSGK